MIYAIMAYSMELLWDMTESAWLLQRYAGFFYLFVGILIILKYTLLLIITKVFMFLCT